MGKVIAGLTDVHPLRKAHIDLCVAQGQPGVYVFGRRNGCQFAAKVVGRSDDCVNGDLSQHAREATYTDFVVVRCNSPREAFHWECALWHALEMADTLSHPCPPDGASYSCRCAEL